MNVLRERWSEWGMRVMHTSDGFPISERKKEKMKVNRLQTDVITPPMKQFRYEVGPA